MMGYEIIATITDELGTRCAPTGIAGYCYADLVLELPGLTRRHPGHRFSIEESYPEDYFNSF